MADCQPTSMPKNAGREQLPTSQSSSNVFQVSFDGNTRKHWRPEGRGMPPPPNVNLGGLAPHFIPVEQLNYFLIVQRV